MEVDYKMNKRIRDIKPQVMEFFKLDHTITFHKSDGSTLPSSHLLAIAEVILIKKRKINFKKKTRNSFIIHIRTNGSNDKLIGSFKKAMLKNFSINEDHLLDIKITRLSTRRCQITFKVSTDNQFCEINFKKNYLFMQNKRITIKPYFDDL